MSFWNLYTEQNKVPIYIAKDYSHRLETDKESLSPINNPSD